jgi:hypothetical protein
MKLSDLPRKNLIKMNSIECQIKSKKSYKSYLSSLSGEEKQNMTKCMQTSTAREKATNTKKFNESKLTESEKLALTASRSSKMIAAHKISTYDYSSDIIRNTKISESKKISNPNFKSIVKCPICGKDGQFAAMKRWHFDNCKYSK